jgi:hypothetical protein
MQNLKTANQLYKESGSTLTFKDWLSREKTKWSNAIGQPIDTPFIGNKPLTDSIQKTLDSMRGELPVKTETSNKTVLGINKTVLLIGGLLIAGAVAYKIYTARKK